MSSDILSCRKVWRIASHRFGSFILIDSDVVETHDGRNGLRNTRPVDVGETVGHAKVGDDGHRLLRDCPLSNISIWTDRSSIQSPGFVFANVPSNITVWTRFVLKGIGLIFLAIIPVVVEVGHSRYCLLVHASGVAVYLRD